MSNHFNVKVDIDAKGAERAIKKFKRLCESCGILKEYKGRKEYKKPSIKKKEKLESNKKRLQKNERRSQQGGRKL